jgi:low temperature requirement protein LtrA
MRIAVSRAPEEERDVSPLELFFDLVYVFAVAQLSPHLLEHIDLRTGAETAIMALAVFIAWQNTAWGANWLDPERLPVRLLLVGLMFASLLMSVAIGDAFDGRAWLFVTGYLLIQLGRSLFLIAALRDRVLGEHFVNVLVWDLLAGVFWVAGAVLDADARLVAWGLPWPSPIAEDVRCTGCPAAAGGWTSRTPRSSPGISSSASGSSSSSRSARPC